VTRSISPKTPGRVIGLFYVGSGLLAVVTIPLHRPGAHHAGLLVVGLMAMAIGAAAWFAPWDRWHRSATLWLALVGFSLIAMGNLLSGDPPYSYAIFFVMVYVWLGVSHPRWTSLRLTPVATAAYVAPLLFLAGDVVANVSSVLVDIPICVVVGESLAWLTDRLGRTQKALQDSEEGYRRLVDLSPDGVVVHDGARIVFANRGFGMLLGVDDPEAIIGHRMADLLTPRRAGRSPTAATDGRRLVEGRVARQDGSLVEVEFSSSPMTFRGQPAVEVVVRDITRRTLEAEAKFQSPVERLPAIVYTADLRRNADVTYVSPGFESLLGFSTQECMANPSLFMARVHPDDLERLIAAEGRCSETGEPLSIQYRMVARTGRVLWFHDDGIVVFDEDTGDRLLHGVMHDITTFKLAEQTLRDSEAREREAVRQLQALHEMKNAFLAAVSHELRTPLTSVLGIALTLRHQSFPPAEEQDLLERLSSNARKLERLLSDLLDVDRLDRGFADADRSRVDVDGLLERTVETADFLQDWAVELDIEPMVMRLDGPKVERIVENLLSNAAKHTPPGSHVWVRAHPFESGVLLVVEDDGPGVPEELRDQIFEPFRQGPSRSAHSPGTGIGLALVARFAELHEGRAWVQERSGGGASFRVYLPDGGVPRTAEAEAETALPTAWAG
jgi:PAS domain S-box-containing protein